MRETMPLLLTESLERNRRESAHEHIENCPVCSEEWSAYKDTWGLLADLPEVEVPLRVREKFLSSIAPARPVANVVPFRQRPAAKWLAQAAAVAVIVGGSYYAGHRTAAPQPLAETPATLTSIQPVRYSIAETRVLPASAISPSIEGRPRIQNVQFPDADARDNKIGVSFDVTSHVTVTGSPTDKSLVSLLSYVLENESSTVTPSRSRAIEWVRQTYSDPAYADPEIANALAKVLRNDEHEGVRIRAVDTLKNLPASVSSPGTGRS